MFQMAGHIIHRALDCVCALIPVVWEKAVADANSVRANTE